MGISHLQEEGKNLKSKNNQVKNRNNMVFLAERIFIPLKIRTLRLSETTHRH